MKIAMVVSGGGHLDEALALEQAFCGHEAFLMIYDLRKSLKNFSHPFFSRIYRLRLFSSSGPGLYLSLFMHLFECLWIFVKERPDVLFSTGSEIAVLPFYLGKFLFRTKTIFLETVTRPQTPSRTAKWLYPVSDFFLVQWAGLLKYFGPKAAYAGKIL